MSFPSVAPRRVARYAFAALAPTMMTSPYTLMLLGPVLGFVGHGYWSMLGSLLSGLFPTNVRASGQGLGYNSGRLAGAAAPYIMGVLAAVPNAGIIAALGLTSAFFIGAAALVFALPDSSKAQLAA